MQYQYPSNLKLSSHITDIPRIGPSKAKFFQKLGIEYVRDLLFHFPRRYDDWSSITSIANLKLGERMVVKAKVKNVKTSWGFQGKRRLLRIFADLEDETGVIQVTWYNLTFLAKQLEQGKEMYIAGTVEPGKKTTWTMRSPTLEFVNSSGEQTHTAGITPVYSETYGISSRFIRYNIKNLLPLVKILPEYLPEEILSRQSLINISEAIVNIHFPNSKKDLEQAQHRLRFDELFWLQLAALVRKKSLQHKQALSIPVDKKAYRKYVDKLSFSLTKAQQSALKDIIENIKNDVPMNRLLQGDVGSGKSAVALLTTALTLDAGYKVLYLAPTEILARQQAEDFSSFLGDKKVNLLVGASKKSEKEKVKQRLLADEALCVVGTHALLQEDVYVEKCALAIVDEQHRFGVAQRKALINLHPDSTPHLLSMTATPIPRTLNLTVYGDLDVSILNELPAGRKPIKTTIVAPPERDKAILHALEQIHAGRQVYVIAPLVEQSDKLEVKSATETYKEMTKLFPGVAVGLVHGQLKSEEKEAVMRNFSAGAIQLLVSTSVVEVGVNVPNATVMIIEGAERFGLAQLHQFRGRIGRGEHASFCYLFPTGIEHVKSKRLKVLESTTDGFVIAEEDLRLRGPGEVYGISQSGFGNLKVASLLDYPTIKAARVEAETLLEQDPALKDYPILKAKVEQKNMLTHFE